jgi:hypothetical protein
MEVLRCDGWDKFHKMPSERFSISVPLNAGEAMKTNIMGTRLRDETGADFVVFNLPWKLLATPDMARATMIAFKNFDFAFAFAIRRAGRWIYVAKESLKAICESKLGQRPNCRRPLPRLHRSQRQPSSLRKTAGESCNLTTILLVRPVSSFLKAQDIFL